MQMEENTNFHNTNATNYNYNKIQMEQNAKIQKYKHAQIQENNIQIAQIQM